MLPSHPIRNQTGVTNVLTKPIDQAEKPAMLIEYKPKDFRDATRKKIQNANAIIAEYETQGLRLTLRQLYYQFVARDLIPNTQKEYKKLGDLINHARLAGLVSWEAIEDRTRTLSQWAIHGTVDKELDRLAHGYTIDRWQDQPCYLEVWVEKEALAGVIENICNPYQVPYFSCRGYVSQSAQWEAAMRLQIMSQNKEIIILHLGDHDPSGLDMTRDNRNRINLFGADVTIKRIALNMDQVEEQNPPPNFAKQNDSRFMAYAIQYGPHCWELDALSPTYLRDLIHTEIKQYLDRNAWETSEEIEKERRQDLTVIAKQYRNAHKNRP